MSKKKSQESKMFVQNIHVLHPLAVSPLFPHL